MSDHTGDLFAPATPPPAPIPRYYPPDPGKTAHLFFFSHTFRCWIELGPGMARHLPENFLKYHEHTESLTLKRYDMTPAEHAAMPQIDAAGTRTKIEPR